MQLPVAIKCKSQFINTVIKDVAQVRITSDSIIAFPVRDLYGLEVIVDDTLESDYEVLYEEVPSLNDMQRLIAQLPKFEE
ncbi:hypothetical protein [Alicyclobacillus acidoterrestris]|uniref:Uncharacterized protein n=1 Tax=Alicyclobacillus acidoterrestris (strain ATCC 49025 / DSM 3922 / CIP 106132 / NCIMB 13137 / GD3B) TaxID=1356854 RepID=T0C583_ALIAG|nr:hypothetical protein [Alicyclobacillus acidoterrestris]EPZ47710.1 hypothetical protein N007_05500 [Alicyclobacillus acidoterrestris ATCC 49025]UNO47977.1 hypothetical protein K1I37_14985 [Alicyclobacillus acidoterrestris]